MPQVDRALFASTITLMNPRDAAHLAPILKVLETSHLIIEHRRAIGSDSFGQQRWSKRYES
jgi:hypothetical protein